MEVSSPSSEDVVLYEVRDRVAWITFTRPRAMNAMTQETRHLLPRYIAEAESSPEVGCLVLTGAGRAFNAGADIKRLDNADDQKSRADALHDYVDELRGHQRRTVLRLYAMGKPTIAAVNGPAFGAGLGLAMACDIRYAARSAKMSAGFGRIAVSGDTGLTWFLTRTIGRAATLEWLYTNEIIDGAEAYRRGAVNKVFDDEGFAERVHAIAAGIAAGSARTHAGFKSNVELASQVDLVTSLHQEALSINTDLLTPDHKEAVRALIEKRAPRFR
jgi:enoyl-CoA hydratase/carnithine racemase